jgi:hypothetical protein
MRLLLFSSVIAFGSSITDKIPRNVRRNIPVGDQGDWNRHFRVVRPLEDAAVSEKTAMSNVYQRYAMLSERSADLSGNRRQEKILGVAFDDDDPACEEKVRLRSVEEAAKEGVIVRL